MEKKLELEEIQYNPDFNISEKYIDFSAELLRLSLLAIAGLSALFMFALKGEGTIKIFKNPDLFVLSLLFFVVASSAALFHRFHATDALSWYISWLRAEKKDDNEKAGKEKKGFRMQLRKSNISLIVCEIAFAMGIVSFLGAIIRLLYSNEFQSLIN